MESKLTGRAIRWRTTRGTEHEGVCVYDGPGFKHAQSSGDPSCWRSAEDQSAYAHAGPGAKSARPTEAHQGVIVVVMGWWRKAGITEPRWYHPRRKEVI